MFRLYVVEGVIFSVVVRGLHGSSYSVWVI